MHDINLPFSPIFSSTPIAWHAQAKSSSTRAGSWRRALGNGRFRPRALVRFIEIDVQLDDLEQPHAAHADIAVVIGADQPARLVPAVHPLQRGHEKPPFARGVDVV